MNEQTSNPNATNKEIKDFEPLYAELKKVKQKTAGGGGGKGWLDEVKAKLSKLF